MSVIKVSRHVNKFRWWFPFAKGVYGDGACMTEVGCNEHHLHYKVLEAGDKDDIEVVSFGIVSS